MRTSKKVCGSGLQVQELENFKLQEPMYRNIQNKWLKLGRSGIKASD
jgi:hypothetical protein